VQRGRGGLAFRESLRDEEAEALADVSFLVSGFGVPPGKGIAWSPGGVPRFDREGRGPTEEFHSWWDLRKAFDLGVARLLPSLALYTKALRAVRGGAYWHFLCMGGQARILGALAGAVSSGVSQKAKLEASSLYFRLLETPLFCGMWVFVLEPALLRTAEQMIGRGWPPQLIKRLIKVDGRAAYVLVQVLWARALHKDLIGMVVSWVAELALEDCIRAFEKAARAAPLPGSRT
jgi:hypothetical protein